MQLIVNGEIRDMDGMPSLGDYLASLNLSSRMVVVERNGDIIAREKYDETPLAHGDVVEIVQMMAGG